MSKTKVISIAALLAVLIACLCLAMVNMFARADEDEEAAEREFNSKYDKLFEDFDREDITDTVSVTGDADTGEKAYLHVEFDSAASGSADNAIFKEGLDRTDSKTTAIVFIVRSPDSSVTLDDLVLGIRYGDSYQVYAKTLSELYDGEASGLSEIGTEWTKLTISITNSYEDDEVFLSTDGEASQIKVNSGSFVGIHLYAAEGASGTLDIQTVYTSTDPTDSAANTRYIWNDFTGGETVDATMNSSAWWSGSSQGYIVRRSVSLSGTSTVNVVNAGNTSEGYGYAIIEVSGDTENLTVATTADGETYGEYSAFTGVVTLDSTICGLSFKYEGSGSVTITSIFFTNYEEDKVAEAVPVIDGTTTSKLDDFNVSQSGITGDYDSMAAAEEAINAGLYYRLSYNNADCVSVAEGALVINATSLSSSDYINFKTQTVTPSGGYRFIVIKLKMTDGATLNGFRFGIGSDGSTGTPVWYGSLMSDVGLALDIDSDPYVTEDGWYYAVIDIEESGLGAAGSSYDTIDIYYSGTGILYIDEIFFANEADKVLTDGQVLDTNLTAAGGSEDYAYVGWISGSDSTDCTVIKLTITAVDTDADVSTLRLESVSDGGVYWFSENAQGTLLDTDGNALVTSIGAGESVTYYIDISGIDATGGLHVHSNVAAAITISDVEYLTYESAATAKVLDSDSISAVSWEGSYNPTTDGYEYLTYVSADNTSGNYDVLVFTVTAEEDTDLSGIRLEFRDASDSATGTYWFSENSSGTLYDTNGNALVTSISAGDSATYYIDISPLGAFAAFHVHSNGAGTGSFTVSGAYLASYVDFYAKAMEDLPVYEIPDVVKPAVSITNGTTAVPGEIEVTYTVSDDVSAASSITVTITVKDSSGNIVTVTNSKFTAEEGVYTVTVTAVDEAGNEASDTIQITVAAASSSDGNNSDDDNNDEEAASGCGGGAATGCGSITMGGTGGMMGLLIVAAVIAVVAIVRRKRAHK